MTLEILTVGHSNRTLEDFLKILKAYRIKNLVDVRRFPMSRRYPYFNGDELKRTLTEIGINYYHFEELGGYRRSALKDSPNTGLRSPGFRAYADYMQTEEFQQAIGKLTLLASNDTTAIMCAEALYFRCHRFLISDSLTVRGIKVTHIESETRARPHHLTPLAQVKAKEIVYPPTSAVE